MHAMVFIQWFYIIIQLTQSILTISIIYTFKVNYLSVNCDWSVVPSTVGYVCNSGNINLYGLLQQ
jgi:hypothetical protein